MTLTRATITLACLGLLLAAPGLAAEGKESGPRVPRVTEMRSIAGEAEAIARLALAASHGAEQWSPGTETSPVSTARALLDLHGHAQRLARQAEKEREQPEKTRTQFAAVLRSYCAIGDRLFELSPEGSIQGGALPPYLGDTLAKFDAITGLMGELMAAYGYDGCGTYSKTNWGGGRLSGRESAER